VKVRAAESIAAGDYPVTVLARGASGSFNLTFQFHVFDHLIIIPQSGALPSGFKPQNLTVSVGSTVTWMSFDGGTDDFAGIHQVSFSTLNVRSTMLHLFDVWAYKFTQPGTYIYEDIDFPQDVGTIVVLPQQ
jgi:plastocyanin